MSAMGRQRIRLKASTARKPATVVAPADQRQRRAPGRGLARRCHLWAHVGDGVRLVSQGAGVEGALCKPTGSISASLTWTRHRTVSIEEIERRERQLPNGTISPHTAECPPILQRGRSYASSGPHLGQIETLSTFQSAMKE